MLSLLTFKQTKYFFQCTKSSPVAKITRKDNFFCCNYMWIKTAKCVNKQLMSSTKINETSCYLVSLHESFITQTQPIYTLNLYIIINVRLSFNTSYWEKICVFIYFICYLVFVWMVHSINEYSTTTNVFCFFNI